MDTGYVGITWFYVNFVVPIKCSKKRLLTEADKVFNHVVSSERVLNVHVIGLLSVLNLCLIVIVIVENVSA
jgi:hypothetical protein